jgi:HEAT repeat protein
MLRRLRPFVVPLVSGSVLLAAAWMAFAAEFPGPVDAELSQIARLGGKYDPRPLHDLKQAGLEQLLDLFFPETATKPTEGLDAETLATLIAQLGAEEYRLREEAMQTLIAKAKANREAVAAATAGSFDPEVRLRAMRILKTWEGRPRESWDRYLAGLAVYLGQIKDEGRLKLLTDRIAVVLKTGLPTGDKLKLLRLCLSGLARSGNEASCDALRPLMSHENPDVAVLLVDTIGSYKSNNQFFPRILIDGLQSDQPKVLAVALKFASFQQYGDRGAEVQGALQKIFGGRNEPQKFQACFPLMHDFDDAAAFDYLLTQAKSEDAGRAHRAIVWIGDACNAGKPATQQVLETLSPHLESKNTEFRRAAGSALAVYSGEEVVRRLLPLLADLQPIVVEETERGIMSQTDKAALARVLAEAAQDHADVKVRERAAKLLQKVGS